MVLLNDLRRSEHPQANLYSAYSVKIDMYGVAISAYILYFCVFTYLSMNTWSGGHSFSEQLFAIPGDECNMGFPHPNGGVSVDFDRGSQCVVGTT